MSRANSTSTVDVRIPRRRFLLLALVIVCCAAITSAHVSSVGNRYWYRLGEFAGKTIDTSRVWPSPDNLVRVADVTYDGDVPVVEFEALTPGDGTVIVDTGDGGMLFSMRVRPDMVIVADEVNFTGWEYIGWSLAACFGAATLICAWNVAWLLRRSWYGYEMAGYAGLMLFSGAQTVIFLQVMLSGDAREFLDLAVLITSIADRFVQLTAVPMALAAVLVSLSNVALVRREGRGLRNLLGIAASLAWAIACLALLALSRADWQDANEFLLLMSVSSLVAVTISFAVALLLGTSLCAWHCARHVPAMPRDYLMVLGCGLRSDGSVTPLLAGRVDAARRYAQAQVKAGYDAPVFVPSGGQGPDERWPEAEAMRRYLLENGVGDAHILKEDESTNTRQNFELSAAKIAVRHEAGQPAPRVAFATTNYHVFRSYVYAHEAGMDAEGISAPTKLYFWPNAFLREFVGLLAAHPIAIGIALFAAIVVYGVAEYVVLIA